MYVSLLPVVEACVVVAVPGRVGEVRVPADEPEAVDLDPGVLARRLDAPATVKAVLEQGGRVLLRSRAVLDPGPSGGRVRRSMERLVECARQDKTSLCISLTIGAAASLGAL